MVAASELFRSINAPRERTSLGTKETITAIENFYRGKGYLLVKIHVISDTGDELSLFVDEGKLAKIIVHENNNYYALQYKQTIDIPGRIYNTGLIQKNIDELKRKYGFAAVRTGLEKIRNYDENVLQLDRELNSVVLFDQKVQVFSKYPAEYELHFYFDYGEGVAGPVLRRDGWGFNIDYNYPSTVIPEIFMYNSGLLFDKDYLETGFSAGFDPGLGGLISLKPQNTLNIPPERTFFKVESEYRFLPFRNTIFTPVIRGRFYYSASGRPDLGYSSFEYITIRGTVAPGITPLDNLNIYAGLGCESDRFYKIEEDLPAADHDGIREGWKNYPFTEMRIMFDPLPSRPGIRREKNIALTLTRYFDGVDFSELTINGARDFEFSNLSILSFKFLGVINQSSAPFNHHAPVNSLYFKGFAGLSYYANRLFEFSSEYRFSVYQDYIYTGLFFDWALFRPEGLLISGVKGGVVAGPTVRFLVYDQFEFTIYVGWDRLLPDGSSQKNIRVRFARTW
ncbi:MAG TPA: hypothetical protein PK514_12250 [Spirochaetota bacterium]|nr:hypothetical protein [Spirochaetota bacterium]